MSGVKVQERVETGEQKTSIWTREFIFIALINFFMLIGFNMTSVGMPVYVSHLGGSDVVVGLVTTLASLASLFIRPFTGYMLDRFGRRGMVLAGITLMTLTIISYMVFPLIGVILVFRVVQGLGWGLSTTANSTMIADALPRKRFAEGMGYFGLTASVAIAFAPALSIALVQQSGPMPMLIIAGACSAISLTFALFQRSKKITVPTKAKFSSKQLFDKKALLPAGIMFLSNLAFAAISTFIALHGQERGVDTVYLYFVVYAIVTIVTRPVIGRIIDRRGFFYPGIFSTVGIFASMMIISFADTTLMFCVAGIFAGLGIGSGIGTFQAMSVVSVSSERRGVAMSTFLFGFDAGFTLGAVIAGMIAASFGYGIMYVVMALFPALACAMFIAAGKKRVSRYSYNEIEEVRR